MTRSHLFITLASATAALAVPQSASAAGIWQVERGSDGICAMTATYAGRQSGEEVSLAFVYDPAQSVLSFVAASPAWADLPNGEANLLVTFDGTAPYTEWASDKAPVARYSGGSHAIVGEWGAKYSKDLAAAATSSKRVAVKVGDTDLGTYDLDRVAESYEELRRCGERS